MKKTLFIASILMVAIISTACINNFAVQDLNSKAQAFMEIGEYDKAIERLKSSIDLDPSIFETHYNLAVAYTGAQDYVSAIEEFKKAQKMKPYNADVYYSHATALNNLVVDMEQGKVRLNNKGQFYRVEETDIDLGEKYELSEAESSKVEQLKQDAIMNYKKYLELNPEAKDRDKVETQIEFLQGETSEQ